MQARQIKPVIIFQPMKSANDPNNDYSKKESVEIKEAREMQERVLNFAMRAYLKEKSRYWNK